MSRLIFSLILTAWMTLGLTGCKTEYAEGCTYHSDCEDGSLCNDDGECEEVDCTTSDDCEAGEYCGERFECKTGCEGDSDCAAGENCTDAHECKAYGCRTTELDCSYGETCNSSTGECEPSDFPQCESCDVSEWTPSCPGSMECIWSYDSGDCNSDSDCDAGYHCDDLDLDGRKQCHSSFCYETCNPSAEEPCPRGFQCGEYNFGYYCFADCEFMTDGGYL